MTALQLPPVSDFCRVLENPASLCLRHTPGQLPGAAPACCLPHGTFSLGPGKPEGRAGLSALLLPCPGPKCHADCRPAAAGAGCCRGRRCPSKAPGLPAARRSQQGEVGALLLCYGRQGAEREGAGDVVHPARPLVTHLPHWAHLRRCPLPPNSHQLGTCLQHRSGGDSPGAS